MAGLTILVLGESDSAGIALADPADAWPVLLQKTLRERTDADVNVVNRRVFFHTPDAADYALMLYEKTRPEVVVQPIGTHAFAVPRVAAAARERFGPRGESTVRWIERGTKPLTRSHNPIARNVNAGGKQLGRWIVGAKPMATYQEVRERYSEVIRRLAAEENLDIVVGGGTRHGEAQHALSPDRPQVADRFNDEIKAVADRHHLLWVDREAALSSEGRREEAYLPDGVHKSPYGHRLVAEAMADAIVGLPSFRSVVAPGIGKPRQVGGA